MKQLKGKIKMCLVPDCNTPAKHKGYCGKHYKRLWRHGDPNKSLLQTYTKDSICVTPGCNRRPKAKGRCKPCNLRLARKGYTELDRAPAGEGRPLTSAGYVLITNGTRVYEHREVMKYKLGRELLPGEIVHHIDGNRSNNAPENLELFSSQSEHIKHHKAQK